MPRTISGDLFRFHLADANNSRITFINKFYILNMIGLTNAWIHISIWGAAQPVRQVSLGCQCHQDGIRAFPKVTLHFPHWNPGATCIISSRENSRDTTLPIQNFLKYGNSKLMGRVPHDWGCVFFGENQSQVLAIKLQLDSPFPSLGGTRAFLKYTPSTWKVTTSL